MPIENRKGLRVVSSDTTMRELWGIPLTITLARQDMAPLFYKARQDAQGDEENADFWQSNAPGAGPIAIALTQDAAIDVWSDREEYGMKGLPEILAKVFGGDGPLTVNKSTPGARAVTEFFGPGRLKTGDFARQLQQRVEKLYLSLQTSDLSYDKVMKKVRSEYLRELFFADVSEKEMKALLSFTNGVFDAALLMSVVLDKFILTLQRKKAIAYKILKPKIKQSKAFTKEMTKEQADNLLDFLIILVMQDIPNKDTLTESELEKTVEMIISSILQDLFAALDTTSSLVGFMLDGLQKDKDRQSNLRSAAFAFLGSKQNSGDAETLLVFEDLQKDPMDPNLKLLFDFVMECLQVHPPTYLSSRTKDDDGTIVLIDIEGAVADQTAKHHAGEQNRGSELAKALKMLFFGYQDKSCKGASFALFEAMMTLMVFLTKSKDISQHTTGRVVRKATQKRVNDKYTITDRPLDLAS